LPRKAQENLGNKERVKRLRSNLYCGTRKEKEGVDVLGLFFRESCQRPWDLLGKGLGPINGDSYQAPTVAVIYGWMRLHPGHIFMQDGAPGHTKKETIEDLIDCGIQRIIWPPFSPDLNPIENVWNWMKDWIWQHYPYNSMSYDQLRKAVSEAWVLSFEAITIYEREVLGGY
jgi:transposase